MLTIIVFDEPYVPPNCRRPKAEEAISSGKIGAEYDRRKLQRKALEDVRFARDLDLVLAVAQEEEERGDDEGHGGELGDTYETNEVEERKEDTAAEGKQEDEEEDGEEEEEEEEEEEGHREEKNNKGKKSKKHSGISDKGTKKLRVEVSAQNAARLPEHRSREQKALNKTQLACNLVRMTDVKWHASF